MAQENQKCTNAFENAIKSYLDLFASKDIEFARKYANEKKSIQECCNYIVDQVRKTGRCGFADDEIYGMAVHYYDEENAKAERQNNCTVVVNHEVELSEEEKERLREQARKEVIAETKRKMTERHQPAKKEVPTEEVEQLSLFDF